MAKKPKSQKKPFSIVIPNPPGSLMVADTKTKKAVEEMRKIDANGYTRKKVQNLKKIGQKLD